MATKLRRFSTHVLTKAAAWLLAVCLLVLSVFSFYDLAHDAYHYELDPEAMFVADYEASNSYYQWLNDLLYDLSYLLETGNADTVDQWLTREGVQYRVQAGDAVYTNAEGDLSQTLRPETDRWIAVEEGEMTVHLLREDQPAPYDFGAYASSLYYGGSLLREDASVLLRIGSDVIADKRQEWEQSRDILLRDVGFIVLYTLPLILVSVYLCIVTGRRPEDAGLHPGKLDKLWSEVLLLLFGGAVALGAGLAISAVLEALYWNRGFWSSRSAVGWLCSLCAVSGYLLGMLFLLAMVRKAKARRFFRHSAIGALLRGLVRLWRAVTAFLRGLFDGSRYQKYSFTAVMFRRRLAYILGSLACVLLFLLGTVSTVFFCLVAFAAEIAITWWYVHADNRLLGDMQELMHQISRIAGGDLTYVPVIDAASPMAAASRQLSDIGGGMQKSVEKQMQSERMKVELVTNVSHDLKTPLTSIISYVDLLSKMEDLPPEARDYIAILAQKSDRLKGIVYDLFELAKSTSGSMEMQSEALDFHRLVEQTLGEMEERILQSGLTVRVALAEPPVTIWADGRKLYRVLQNVIDNALKYSLAGTRVFVELQIIGSRAVLTIKNTSAYEMDFTPEEITERFVRGDKSRSEEGSGLGLSIAQSFTQACGGQFHVSIDGDQFKVHISFDLYRIHPAAGADASPLPGSAQGEA